MNFRRVSIVLVLVLWVLVGPVGMALSGCMMMDGCDAHVCSVSSTAPIVAADLAVAPPASGLAVAVLAFVLQNVWTVLDSPPKPAPILL